MRYILTLLTALLLAPLATLHAADPPKPVGAAEPKRGRQLSGDGGTPAVGDAAGQPKLQTGLAYELFGNPALDRLQEAGSAPDIGPMDQGHNDWGLRFTGLLTSPMDGDYVFRAEADMGVRLKLDGKPVIDGWAQGGARTGKATLAKSRPAAIVVEYFFDRVKGGKKAALRLFWTPPGGQETPLPATAYSHLPPPSLIWVGGNEKCRLNLQLPDGGLKPVVGVQNIQVFRSCRVQPELVDQNGTYNHQVDLGVWKGRMYAVWAMGRAEEIEPEYRLLYATSTDGTHWSAPADLFPRPIAWYCRFYFYRATNGRMLALCPHKPENPNTFFPKNLLVREIAADHRLGKVFTLIDLDGSVPKGVADFKSANDAGFIAACHEAIEQEPLLEQQDLGTLLGNRRMKWHDDPQLNRVGYWKFGKALCFYHRQDGALVGLCKMGYATLSGDNGRTWTRPVQPPSLVAGSGKIWGQRTADGRYVLAYNPERGENIRWPLVMVHGDDGTVYKDMRVIHGELPRIRYSRESPGPQYMRGLAEWAADGTFADEQALWLIYSVHKEDIWVSRIPLPVKPDETAFPADDFTKIAPGAVVPGWNLYSPKWAPVSVVENAAKSSLELRDGDPYDYARAVRVFPEAAQVWAELELTPAQANARLEIELCDAGGRRPVRVALTETGLLQAADGKNVTVLGKYTAGETLSLVMAADAAAGRYSVQVNGGAPRELAVAEAGAKTLQRLSVRTGVWRGLGNGGVVDAAADVPLPNPAVFQMQRVKIGSQ
jgi:hypothetical protein